ncbi:MAG TPA: PAS domain S-box protein, partial [Phenylobacterium sp.]|nr:PAS domain S-box protein [Phenylobacterium sp.]
MNRLPTRPVTVTQATPADPWDVPRRDLGRLLGFDPETPHHSRVRVRGTVTYADDSGLVFIQSADAGLRLEIRSGPLPRPGEAIEALGFPRAGDYDPTLRYSLTRPAPESGPPPGPVAWSAQEGVFHARLVRAEARVRELISRPDGWTWLLESDLLGSFEAHLRHGPGREDFRPPPPDSVVRLTGVAEAHSENQRLVTRMTLWLRGPADVVLGGPAPFWTRSGMQQLAGVLAFALFLAGAWGSYLRRRVLAQADQLVERISRERELEHRFHELVEHASDLIFITDAEGTLVRWNRATGALLAMREGQPTLNLLLLVIPEDRGRLHRALQRALAGEELGPLPFTIAVGPERRIVLESTARRVVPGDKVPLIESVARDITARHRAEAALRASEERLQATVQNTPHVCIQWFDAQGRVRLWNRASETIYGYPAAEAEGRRLAELIFEPDQEREFDALLAGIASDGRPRGPMFFDFRARNGRRGVCLSTVFAIPGHGKDSWFVCMDVDLTERRAAERALQESEARFRALTEHSPVGIYLQDAEGRCLYTNQRWQEITGRTGTEALGHGWLKIIHPEDLPGAKQAWEDHLAGGEPMHVVHRHVRSDGTLRWVESLAEAHHDEQGRLVGVVGAVRGIDQEKRTELELVQARLDAEAESEAKSRFLATVSHEIRTPLNGIYGMAQALAREDLPEAQQSQVEVICRSSESLLAIINDVLDLSKISVGKVELEAVDFDVVELATGVCATFAALSAAKGLQVKVTATPSVAGAYRGDAGRLRQVLSNLVSNAVKFTAMGGVTVDLDQTSDGLVIGVTDTGIGIAPDNQARIFEPFVQADVSTTRRFGGTGLGLAICRELVAAMGGALSLESRPAAGSCFRLQLPLTPVSAQPPAAPSVAGQDAEGPADMPALRVLAAEDNSVNQLVLATLLGQMGVEPAFVSDGVAALDAWRREAWD